MLTASCNVYGIVGGRARVAPFGVTGRHRHRKGIYISTQRSKKAPTRRHTQGRTAAPRCPPHTFTGGIGPGKTDGPITGADSARMPGCSSQSLSHGVRPLSLTTIGYGPRAHSVDQAAAFDPARARRKPAVRKRSTDDE